MRTRLQAYKQVLASFEAGKLGAVNSDDSCVYRANGRYCGAGCLFTEAQLDDIYDRGLNGYTSIQTLSKKIGKKNIEYVTGLTLAELATLQMKHDEAFTVAYSNNISKIDDVISTGKANFKAWLLERIDAAK
jgi:hypothetical protein